MSKKVYFVMVMVAVIALIAGCTPGNTQEPGIKPLKQEEIASGEHFHLWRFNDQAYCLEYIYNTNLALWCMTNPEVFNLEGQIHVDQILEQQGGPGFRLIQLNDALYCIFIEVSTNPAFSCFEDSRRITAYLQNQTGSLVEEYATGDNYTMIRFAASIYCLYQASSGNTSLWCFNNPNPSILATFDQTGKRRLKDEIYAVEPYFGSGYVLNLINGRIVCLHSGSNNNTSNYCFENSQPILASYQAQTGKRRLDIKIVAANNDFMLRKINGGIYCLHSGNNTNLADWCFDNPSAILAIYK